MFEVLWWSVVGVIHACVMRTYFVVQRILDEMQSWNPNPLKRSLIRAESSLRGRNQITFARNVQPRLQKSL
jgi:hypothetical protein